MDDALIAWEILLDRNHNGRASLGLCGCLCHGLRASGALMAFWRSESYQTNGMKGIVTGTRYCLSTCRSARSTKKESKRSPDP
jgi:hypothetical protein